MKTLLIIILLSAKCYGQTYDEWVRQKKTQKKYLLEQILALKTYAGYAQKGYFIAKVGLNTISDIKNGDFNLHDNFFKSLSAVNPEIKKYSRVAAIIAMQISITRVIRKTSFKELSNDELNYLRQVFNNVLDACAQSLDELIALVTDGEKQMKDDERIRRIDGIYNDMQDKQIFVQSFSNSAKRLSVQRRKELYDIEIERKLNNLK